MRRRSCSAIVFDFVPLLWYGCLANPKKYQKGGNIYKKRTIVALATSILLTVNTPATLATQVPADDSTSISTESTLANGKAVTEENVLEILRQLEQEWPTWTIWGTRHTPNTHKNEVPCAQACKVMNAYRISEAYGCSGYASMVSSLIFGDEVNPARRLEDLEQIRPGDIIFMVRSETGKVWHVAVALESPNEKNAFHITDGNAGETVQWPDRENPYGRDNLDCYRGGDKSYHLEVWTRYPENVPYTGDSVMGWPTGK